MFFSAILVVAHILTISNGQFIPALATCDRGAPLAGQVSPDVNLTVQPSLNITVFTPITIDCDAGASSNSSLPPVEITIRVGIYTVKICGDGTTAVYECVYNLRSFFPGLPRRISCAAENANGDCRYKDANATLRPLATTTAPPTTTAAPTTPVTTATTNPPTTESETTTTSRRPTTPTDDKKSTARTPVDLTTIPVILSTPTTTPTSNGGEDDDSEESESESESEGESDSEGESSD